MFLLLPFYFVADVLMTIIAVLFVNWWAPLFANDAGYLPRWLAWFQTFDDSLDAGMRDGIFPATMSRYRARWKWLNRNPAYGFSYWALGIPFDCQKWKVVQFTPPAQGPLTFFAVGPRGAFNWYGNRLGLHMKIGWKVWNMIDSDVALSTGQIRWRNSPWGPAWRIPFVFSISRA